jgi:hypothetical protein
VVTLEELARRQQLNTDQAKDRFQLTNREQSVIEHAVPTQVFRLKAEVGFYDLGFKQR